MALPAPGQYASPELNRFFAENRLHGETDRVARLKRKYCYARSLEYAHLAHDWSGRPADAYETISPQVLVPKGFEVPLQQVPIVQRRPTAPSRLCKTVVERFTGLVFSEDRKPRVSVEGDPASEDFLQAVIEQSQFWTRMREARTLGGACGAVAASVHLREGRFEIDVHPAWQVMPWWEDRRSLKLKALLKQYEFVEQEEEVDPKTGQPTGKLVDKHYLYRRFMDASVDVIFKPWPTDLGPPAWQDPPGVEPGSPGSLVQEAVRHGLGACPAVWTQNVPCVDDFDGDADCEGAWQTLDAIDRLTAQVNRSLLVNLDPTAVLTTDMAYLESMGGMIRKGSDNMIALPQGSSFDYREIGAAGITAAFQLIDRLRQQALDICRAVIVDPSTISGAAQSAKAIEYLYAPMLEKADDLRSQYGECLVRPLLERALMLARHVGPEALDMAPRVVDGQPQARAIGPGGRIVLKWGPYFSASAQDVIGAVQAATAAKAGELVDREHAAKKVAPYFGVEDVQAMLEKAKQEAVEAQEMAMPGPPELPEWGAEEEPRLGEDEGGERTETVVPAGEPRSGEPGMIRISGRMGEE